MSLWSRLVNVIRGDRLISEIDEELESHVAEAIAHGRDPEEARKAFGTLLRQREASRDIKRVVWLGDTMRDVHDAIRSLRSAPGFTAVALVVLTLGIGATTAIFSVVDAVVLRPLPFGEPDRLVELRQTRKGRPDSPVAPQDFLDWRAQQDVFEGLAGVTVRSGFISRENGQPETLRAQAVSASLFSILRVAPRLGSVFSAGNEVGGNHLVAIISDRLWRLRFGANPGVIGATIPLDNGTWIVQGVMPPDFAFPLGVPVDMWVPYVMAPDETVRSSEHNNYLQVIGRLRPGVTIDHARARMTQISGSLARTYPAWFKTGNAAVVIALRDSVVNGTIRSWMLMLLAAVAFVLMIACVNVANLLLARATARGREMGIRVALGASRWRLARGLLVESLVLSMLGTLLGIAVAYFGVELLRSAMPPRVPRVGMIAVNLRVLATAALASIATGVGFGLVPAVQSSRPDVVATLREGGRGGTASARRQRWRMGFVVAEVALALVLLVGTGLFVASFTQLLGVDIGLDYHHVLTVAFAPPLTSSPSATSAPDLARATTVFEDVVARARTVPGVDVASALAGAVPFAGNFHRTDVQVPGGSTFSGVDGADLYYVTPDYFRVLQVSLIRGRLFDVADDRAGAAPVVIVNEAAGARYLDATSVVGRTLDLPALAPPTPSSGAPAPPPGVALGTPATPGATAGLTPDRMVVGVIHNMRPLGPETPIRPEVYIPLAQGQPVSAYLVLRSRGDAEALGPAVQAAMRSVAPGLMMHEPQTLESLFGDIIAQRRFNMLLLSLFGFLAIAIAAAGIYGVMAYVVEQRRQEIGVRLAMGALPYGVVRMVLSRALALMGVGLAVGLPVAWGLADLIRAFLFQVRPHDVGVYVLTPAVLLAAGLAAAFVPALRAARVDPLIALRAE